VKHILAEGGPSTQSIIATSLAGVRESHMRVLE